MIVGVRAGSMGRRHVFIAGVRVFCGWVASIHCWCVGVQLVGGLCCVYLPVDTTLFCSRELGAGKQRYELRQDFSFM